MDRETGVSYFSDWSDCTRVETFELYFDFWLTQKLDEVSRDAHYRWRYEDYCGSLGVRVRDLGGVAFRRWVNSCAGEGPHLGVLELNRLSDGG